MRNEVLVAGQSHVFAMGVPSVTGGEPHLKPISEVDGISFIAVVEAWVGRRTEAYWNCIAENCKDRTVLIVWNGNQHNAAFLIQPDPPFDLILDGDDPVDLTALVIVPTAVVREYFRRSLEEVPPIIERLKDAGAGRIILLGTPAPKPDPEHLAVAIRTAPFFVGKAKEMGLKPEDIRVSPTALRVKLWSVLQGEMEKVAKAAQVPFISVPEGSLSADGSLLPEYATADASHANSAYGKLVLQLVASRLQPAGT